MCLDSHLLNYLKKIKRFVVPANAHVYINAGRKMHTKKNIKEGKDNGSNICNS